MAQHNPSSRAYLLIVLGGIVIGFVIAAYLLSGGQEETGAKVDKMEQPAATDTAPAEAELPVVEPAEELPPRDVMPGEAIPEDAMPDDAMPEDAMPDEAPDAMTPDQNPEQAVPENPPPAPNP